MLARIYDNALLYKDITQWLRNRTFVVLFLGTLALSEIIFAFISTLPLDEGTAGPVTFGWLCTLLSGYLFIICFSGYGLTAREFSNRTFELFELSGMSLERMVLGKFYSMFVQFCFGFFCIVPFMFASFLLGGLDFYTILAWILLTALSAPPLFIGSIGSAFLSRYKAGRGIVRILFGLCIMFGSYILIVLFYTFYGFGGGRSSAGPVELLKELISLNADAWIGVGLFFLFYIQVILLLFYLCCNAISPPTDTREGTIKWLCMVLFTSVLNLTVYFILYDPDPEYLIAFNMVVYPGILLIGLMLFYHRLDTPLMAYKQEQGKKIALIRWGQWLFRANAWGTFRMLIVMYIIISGTGLALYGITGSSEVFDWMSLSAMTPFFLVFPVGILIRFRVFRLSIKHIRTLTFAWWGVMGFIQFVGFSIMSSVHGTNAYIVNFLEALCMIFSPLSTLATGTNRNTIFDATWPFHCGFGALGIYLMWCILRYRERLDNNGRVTLNGGTLSAPADSDQSEQHEGTV